MEATKTQGARKEVTKSVLEVTRVYKTEFQKEGTLTAEIKQTVTTKSFYPSKSVASNMQDNPFANSDFGFTEQEFVSTEKRVAWIDVPKDSTEESVKEILKKFPEATLFKVLANKPILTDNQIYGINAGLTSEDAIGEKQLVRYPEGSEKAGEIVYDNLNKPQYRAVFFKTTGHLDLDQRTAEPSDFYATPSVKAALAKNSVTASQDAL